jgi:hypothetical protein
MSKNNNGDKMVETLIMFGILLAILLFFMLMNEHFGK